MVIADGRKIVIKFSQSLAGEVSGNESHFLISFDVYEYVPDGSVLPASRVPSSVESVDEYSIALIFDAGVTNSFQRAVGDIVVSYDGKGTLVGLGGPVAAFERAFSPVDLLPKDDPHSEEHVVVAAINVGSTLTQVHYSNTKDDEHVDVTSIVVDAALIHVDDI